MDQQLYEKLQQLALERTKPFCYSCYEEASSETCSQCGSDDLMRLLPGVGCEYGLDWAVTEIIEEELTPVDLDESFEEVMRDSYPQTTEVAWLSLDTILVLKHMDPVSWRCAQSEWESEEESSGTMISFDNGATYYRTTDLQALV